jgi:PAS domain S-box-containing protein
MLSDSADPVALQTELTVLRQRTAELEQQLAEQRQTEQEIREREAMYSQILEATTDFVASADPQGRVRYLNQAGRRMLGVDADADISALVLADLHPTWAQTLVRDQGIPTAIQDGVWEGETALLAPDGREIVVSQVILAHRAPTGDMTSLSTIARDITDRKRAEEERDRFFTLSLDMLCIAGFDGYFRRLNPAWERTLGFTVAELQAKPFMNFVHPDDCATTTREMERIVNGVITHSFENRYRCKDGSYRWLLWTAVPFLGEGLIYAAAHDITDRKQTEVALLRAARLKDEFLTGMSHELRTPLNAILGLSEALEEQVYGPLNERQLTTLRTIEESGRHLLALINDILDLSKIEAGEMAFDHTPVAVASLCQASVQFIKQLAFQKRLEVTVDLDPAVRTIQGDERRLKQILINLLSNAVKFTPAGRAIGLTVVGEAAQEVVRFTVWDQGVGIAAEHRPQLFQPFVQIDSSLTRQYAGTGLGLALVARMAAMHGGSIAVESTVNEGSRFTVALPWHARVEGVAAGEAAPLDAADWPSGRLVQRALIIEDSPTTASQLSRYLDELGVASVVSPHGAGAVAHAVEVHPDLIILDILLPSTSGWMVLQHLKADPRTQAIPTLVISVVDEPLRGLELGASVYLVKPINRDQLHRALEQMGLQPAGRVPAVRVMIAAPAAVVDQPVILLAEDNEANITTLNDYLTAKGYRVVVARNGKEALGWMQDIHPSVVLMDIQMPEMDGLAVIEHIRADPRRTGLPIIALTAQAMPGERERCLAAGANDYLSKPVRLKDLVTAIETHRSHLLSPKGDSLRPAPTASDTRPT